MSNTDDMVVVARVKRAMPRNADVMRVCQIAEEGMARLKQSIEEHLSIGGASVGIDPAMVRRFNKKVYQREYMRKRRAKK